MNPAPQVQTLQLDASMPDGMQCLLLTQDAPRPELRPHVHRTLLEMLAGHLGAPASELELLFTESGKPRCPQAEAAGLSFSFSYAPPHVCIVTGPASSIGVDIERVIAEEPAWNLLEHVFTEQELQQWLRLPAGEVRRRAFTTAWTVKEATLKARGTGLADSPQSVGVIFTADGLAAPADAGLGGWQGLNSIPGVVGTLIFNV
ncbi:4'-phosphopantetheinyl transferase family protein [Prosthecobacter vanneervenii]|uniref:Phosphopantetheinyl transferase n=1 Tax=Prosthecobacter vanneervenii TaxID=48466 RepID=A0A7W7YCD0_9BACT|nr:4'-phosphopantetheinyl transferase superfamily protein [Prosthecobacter vanneervenii]MBB5033583.1 phosphopantetheinyl transferase [Prosthecobacter vanneervenii]